MQVNKYNVHNLQPYQNL